MPVLVMLAADVLFVDDDGDEGCASSGDDDCGGKVC